MTRISEFYLVAEANSTANCADKRIILDLERVLKLDLIHCFITNRLFYK